MTEPFDSINAPQFVDFSEELENEAVDVDAYFEVDHENAEPQDVEEIQECTTPNCGSNSEEYEHYYTPGEAKNEVTSLQGKFLKPKGKIRKSLSMDHLLPKGPIASHPKKIPSQEHLDRLAAPKHRNHKSEEKLDFKTMAECVRDFQTKTPKRFRSKPDLSSANKSGNKSQSKHTVPQSPALATKQRIRPLYFPTREEREQKEYEEALKFKIKAHPVNKKILHGPVKAMQGVEKKAPTVPKPFNLTSGSMIRKATPVNTPKKEFHAKPVPKSVIEPVKPLHKSQILVTKPETPSFMRKYRLEMEKKNKKEENKENKAQTPVNARPALTRPQPFSFEERDKYLVQKKENFINRVHEEEKKAREFHARPVPKKIFQAVPVKSNLTSKSSSLSNVSEGRSSSKSRSEENLTANGTHHFKARPPTVLYKEPFIPKKEEKTPTVLSPFQLSTEIRAKEREEYDKKLKEKEQKLDVLRHTLEEERLKQEEEERARLRKELEYKAHPIRKFKPLEILPSNKVTVPITPDFHTDRIRREKQSKSNISS